MDILNVECSAENDYKAMLRCPHCGGRINVTDGECGHLQAVILGESN